MSEKRPITVQLDPQMVLALDAVAANAQTSRSEALEQLLDLAIQAQEVQRKRVSQKANLTLRVDAATADRVRGVAKARGETLNAAAVFLVEAGLQAQLDGQSAAAVESLAQELRAAVVSQQAAHDAQVHRLAHLLTRCVLENLATRNVASALLGANGVDKAGIVRVTETAWTQAVDMLRNPPPATRAALSELTRHG